jgi:hypothetical protein
MTPPGLRRFPVFITEFSTIVGGPAAPVHGVNSRASRLESERSDTEPGSGAS